jgi:hypothetical protein
MTIPATGTVTLRGTAARHGIQAEFGAATTNVRVGAYYRGRANVPAGAKASIATAGTQKFSNYRGAAKVVLVHPDLIPNTLTQNYHAATWTPTTYPGGGTPMITFNSAQMLAMGFKPGTNAAQYDVRIKSSTPAFGGVPAAQAGYVWAAPGRVQMRDLWYRSAIGIRYYATTAITGNLVNRGWHPAVTATFKHVFAKGYPFMGATAGARAQRLPNFFTAHYEIEFKHRTTGQLTTFTFIYDYFAPRISPGASFGTKAQALIQLNGHHPDYPGAKGAIIGGTGTVHVTKPSFWAAYAAHVSAGKVVVTLQTGDIPTLHWVHQPPKFLGAMYVIGSATTNGAGAPIVYVKFAFSAARKMPTGTWTYDMTLTFNPRGAGVSPGMAAIWARIISGATPFRVFYS